MQNKVAVIDKAPVTWRHWLAIVPVLVITTTGRAAVSVEARSSSLSQAGPQPVASFALVQNGVLPTGGGNLAGPNGSTEAGPIGEGTTRAFANSSQIDGAVLTVTMATADLATASLGVFAQAGGGEDIGVSIANGIPTWTDKITFHNVNDSAVELDLFWDTDGSVVDQSGPDFGSIDITSSIVVNIANDADYQDIHFKGAPAFSLGGAQFVYNQLSGALFAFQPSGNNMFGAWTTTSTGEFTGVVKATLVVPSGVVSIDITTLLSIDCRSGALCDYTDGATFSFGDLPQGLTWTSESGVFLRSTPAGSLDTDNDGTPDVSDGCPGDPLKTAPGQCGCGAADSDTDGDGVCDDNDNCPTTANADQADVDNDGVGDICAPFVVSPDGDGMTPQAGPRVCGAMGMLALWPISLGLMLTRRRAAGAL